MSDQDGAKLFKQIDFGDIDGLFDPQLERYFIDFNYWNNIVDSNAYFVIGRKGTGKSAIYNWISLNSTKRSSLVSNLSFRYFPFEKLLALNDENFSAPNQYQSIWRNIILSEYARLVVIDQSATLNDYYKELVDYVSFFFGHDLVDLHKKVTEHTNKTSLGLQNIASIGHDRSVSVQYQQDYSNVTIVNRRLQETIENYLITCGENKLIIQFDQLDDNYNQFADKAKYFHAIISLFKTVYDLNQTFRKRDIRAKAILYLRSDIFYAMHQRDSESARWDDYIFYLNWAIVSRSDWGNPKLLQILNKRIQASLPELRTESAFHYFFPENKIRIKDLNTEKSVFKYIIDRSFHRPRDVIQFAKKIQIEVRRRGAINREIVRNAEREYSLWFLSELENELGPRIEKMELLYEFLRRLGKNYFRMHEFSAKYDYYAASINIPTEELLHILYDSGIILNVDVREKPAELFSIIRNERSRFNRDLQIVLHRGFWSGLSTTRYLRHM